MRIYDLRRECGFEDAWIKNDPVQLQGKELFEHQEKHVIFIAALITGQ